MAKISIQITHLPKAFEDDRVPRMNVDCLLKVHPRKLQSSRSKETHPKAIPMQRSV